MYFTRAQMRALWFIIGIFACSVAYQYVRFYFLEREEYDFRELDDLFKRKLDSLQATQPADTFLENPGLISTSEQPVVIYHKFPVNINTASEQELQNLPRIGPAMAARIILHRQKNGPFRSKDDLMKVKGIGKKTFDKLKDLITLH